MNVGIVGLGLIGGSLGLDLRLRQTAAGDRSYRVLGVSRRAETCDRAVAQGAVDAASPDWALLTEAEIVVLCTPLHAIAAAVDALIPHLDSAAVLTDVGSVKAPVVEAIAPRWQNFVGGHPMAGKAESGLDAAEAGLFAGKPYVLTPTPDTPEAAIAAVSGLAQAIGAEVHQCSPAEHDRAVAWISHLPVMVSASLIAACLSEADPTVAALAQQFASSGFRDTSRVGGGAPELGGMMARYNQAALLRSLHAYRTQLDRTVQIIEQGDWAALETRLQQTQGARSKFVR